MYTATNELYASSHIVTKLNVCISTHIPFRLVEKIRRKKKKNITKPQKNISGIHVQTAHVVNAVTGSRYIRTIALFGLLPKNG